MKQLYGTSFLTMYGETPSALWVTQIAMLTDDECRRGLSRLAEQRREFPANLTEFLEACRPRPQGVRFLGRPQSPDDVLKLPGPRASREVIERHLAHMREVVRS